jgi:hypothetical protein
VRPKKLVAPPPPLLLPPPSWLSHWLISFPRSRKNIMLFCFFFRRPANLLIHNPSKNDVARALQTRGQIYESTISLRFLGIILRFLRLEVSTFGIGFLQNAIHEQTWVFFIDWMFCMDFWNHKWVLFSIRFSSFSKFQVGEAVEISSPRKPKVGSEIRK